MNATETGNEVIMIYQVGGCVRDEVMGKIPKDFDYVVVGKDEEFMLQKGFKKVGADFPVFLHPETKEEYALARVERKSGKGYNGFSVYSGKDVTLIEDLGRRDFTINSMAFDQNKNLIDPYDGAEDIENCIIRHVSGQSFIDDPVRILRACRFAARYNFTIHPETLELIKSIDKDELKSLTKERILLELKKALDDKKGFTFLRNIHNLDNNIFENIFGFYFTDRFYCIDAMYEKLGINGVLILIHDSTISISNEKQYFKDYNICKDVQMICGLVLRYPTIEVDHLQSLIRSADFRRRPNMLVFFLNYKKIKTITSFDVLEVAQKFRTIKLDVTEGMTDIEIRDEILRKQNDIIVEKFNLK